MAHVLFYFCFVSYRSLKSSIVWTVTFINIYNIYISVYIYIHIYGCIYQQRSCSSLTSETGRIGVLPVVEEWTIISVEVCIEPPFISSHWAHGRGRLQGGLALAQPGAHHQVAELHLWPFLLRRWSTLTLRCPQACWMNWGFACWASTRGAFQVCKQTGRKTSWSLPSGLSKKKRRSLFRTMFSPASLFSKEWSSSDTFRKTSSRVVSITPKLVKARWSKLCSKAFEKHVTQKNKSSLR